VFARSLGIGPRGRPAGAGPNAVDLRVGRNTQNLAGVHLCGARRLAAHRDAALPSTRLSASAKRSGLTGLPWRARHTDFKSSIINNLRDIVLNNISFNFARLASPKAYGHDLSGSPR
jgi:hypothetical protein